MEKIFSFIAKHAAEDKHFYEKLKMALLPDDGKETRDMDYYRKKAKDCFDSDNYSYRRRNCYDYDYYASAYEASGKLDNILSAAALCVEQGKYAAAAVMAMSVMETIPRNYEYVDDSDGTLTDTFETAVELLCGIINNPEADDSIKKGIFSWSKEETTKQIYSDYGFDDVKTIYKLCCERFGDTDEVLADIDNKIKEVTDEYRRSNAVQWKIQFMQSRNLDIQGVIQEHLDLNDVRKIRFNQLIANGLYDEALNIAEQGIEIARRQNHSGTVSDWKKSMFDIYIAQGDTAKLLPMAEQFFLQEIGRYPRDEFYDALKKYTAAADWPDTLERLLTAAEKEYYNSFVARIMSEHQMWPRLMAYCKEGGVARIEQYEKDLKPHFEKEILEFYRNYIEKRALVTDQNAYLEVARTLKRMRTFSGGDVLVNQLLNNYRATYKRRKNMMIALASV